MPPRRVKCKREGRGRPSLPTARVGFTSVAHALEAAGAVDGAVIAIADQTGLRQHHTVVRAMPLAVTVIAVALWLVGIAQRDDTGMRVAVLGDIGPLGLVMRLGVAIAVGLGMDRLGAIVVARIGHGGADDGQRGDTRDDLGGIIVGTRGRGGEAGHRQSGGEDDGDETTVQHGGILSGCRRRLAVGKGADPFMTQGWASLPRTGNNTALLSDNRSGKARGAALDIE